MSTDLLDFEEEHTQESIIKVLGVGGGGSNAVNYMYRQGIKDVDFLVCNTDSQALTTSPIPIKIQLGQTLTDGRGAGGKPEVGRQAALESIDDVARGIGEDTKMIFITAGMGGGTGTGAAPVIAKSAKERGILTVGIVTLPFRFEGNHRRDSAIEGITEMSKGVDSLLVINNELLKSIYGDQPISEAFSKADNVLTVAAKGIAEIITVPGYVNVDFEDVKTVMRDSGVALMGSGRASGPDRCEQAIQNALTSPLLNSSDIHGAKNILLNISSGSREATMDEIYTINQSVQKKAGNNANLIWGNTNDPSLEDEISVTVIATGFTTNIIPEVFSEGDGDESKSNVEMIEEQAKESIEKNTYTLNDPEAKPKKKTSKAKKEDPMQGSLFDTVPAEPKVEPNEDEFKIERLDYTPEEEEVVEEAAPRSGEFQSMLRNGSFEPSMHTKKLDMYEKIPAFKRHDVNVGGSRPTGNSDISRFNLS